MNARLKLESKRFVKKVSKKMKRMFRHGYENRKTVGYFALVIVFILSLQFYSPVMSSVLDNVSGYAWGADDWADVVNVDNIQSGAGETMSPPGGMGWLSLNCISGGVCGSVNYGINIGADGYITGYGWSPNYGWFKFGGLSDFPTGGGTTADNAKLVGSNITGWARFCSAAANPSLCTGFVRNLRNGGWDGWVSLRGNASDSSPYGLALTGGAITGYAWGGNDDGANVVGWINFSNASYNPVTDPTVSIEATPAEVPEGDPVILTWEVVNADPTTYTCQATGDWSGAQPVDVPAGGVNVGTLPTGTYNFSIQCFGPNGEETNIDTVEVTVGGSTILDFYASPSPVYPPYQTNLFWNAVPSSPGLSNCVADSSAPLNVAPVPGWSGTVFSPPSSLLVSVPYNPTNFKLTCEDSLGESVTATVSVPQGTLPESVSLASSEIIENPPSSGNYSTTLTWSTVNANSCYATGGWGGNKANSGSEADVPVPAISPAFTVYTITCTGIYSGEIISASVELNQESGVRFSVVQPTYQEQ